MPDVKKRLLRYYSLTEEEYEAMAKPATFDDIPLLPETPDLVRAKTRIELGVKNPGSLLPWSEPAAAANQRSHPYLWRL